MRVRHDLLTSGACLLAAALLAPGCSSKIRLAEVGGTVTKAGAPQKNLWVQFAPAKGGRPAEGRTNDAGRYKLDYSRGRQGAPLGTHRVTVMSGGNVDADGNEVTPRKVVFKGEFEVKSGVNAIDVAIP